MDDSDGRSILEQREAIAASGNFMTKTIVKTTPFLLIAAPDATMTLRTLQAYLGQWLVSGRVVQGVYT